MKPLMMIALMLGLGTSSIHAQQAFVKMTFSGIGTAGVLDLKQPNSNNTEENVTGNGTLGSYTFRILRASMANPQQSTTCSGLFFPALAGAGILRFEDGTMLKVSLKDGGDCIDLVNMAAHCTLTFEIQGGSGRFKSVTGTLTYTEAADAVLFDAQGNFVMGTEIGEITGTISGLSDQDE